MASRSVRLSQLFATVTLPTMIMTTGVFPDVAANHPFKGEIESLFRAGIVKGYPDGNYYPDKSVNRAEFLKLLYTATGRKPRAVLAKCFPDIEPGSWYESFVCDAASKENGFVQGYGDGKFRPGNPVSRTEALKMTFTVMGLPVSDVSPTDKDVIKFVDISTAAWYSKYISSGYKVGILPITGFGGARFYPDKEISRGESAAYIFQGMKVKGISVGSSSSASSRATESYRVKEVVFPFNDTDQFQGKKPVSYVFTLKDEKTVVSIHAATTGNVPSDMTCRLYLLDDEGFTSEYYLGVQDGGACKIHVEAGPGLYQLQVQPSVPDLPYFVDAKTGSTDGNDGFMSAKKLTLNSDEASTLDVGDLYDWFTFTVDAERKGTIMVVAPERLECIIYSPNSVDQFGFTGPECGVEYSFGTGKYTVGVGRKPNADLSKSVGFTLRLR